MQVCLFSAYTVAYLLLGESGDAIFWTILDDAPSPFEEDLLGENYGWFGRSVTIHFFQNNLLFFF